MHYHQLPKGPSLRGILLIPISAEEYEERLEEMPYREIEGLTDLTDVYEPLPCELAEQFEEALARVLTALGYTVHRDWESND